MIACVITVSGISIPKTFLQSSNAAIAPLPDPYLTSGKSPLSSSIPFIRLPIPKNPKPELLTYDGLQQVFQTWIDDMATVRATIAPIRDQNVKVALRLELARLDFDGNGKAEDKEMLWQIFNAVTGANVSVKDAQQFLIAFDRGDNLWL